MKATPWLVAALVLLGATVSVYAAVGAQSPKRPRHRAFAIRGDLRAPLRPGSAQLLDLTLRNRRGFTLWVTRLRVRLSVDAGHRAAGCTRRRDFRVRQLRRRAYPLRLPARRIRTLTRLGVRVLPRVRMRDLPSTNQDACKGARLRLRYSGRAGKRRPRHARRRAAGAGAGIGPS